MSKARSFLLGVLMLFSGIACSAAEGPSDRIVVMISVDGLAQYYLDDPKAEMPAELRGTHGHDPNQPNMHATFVAWGFGVKSGAKLGVVSNLDVAPTVAALLGFPMKDVEGKILSAALVNHP
jgi:hypothetical protein